MKRAILICDPISSKASVQRNLVRMVRAVLDDFEQIDVFSAFVPESVIDSGSETPQQSIFSLSSKKRFLQLIYRVFEKNESLLWAISWVMESVFRANSACYGSIVSTKPEDTVINISYTVPAICTVLWNQATPPLQTLSVMGEANVLARIFYFLFSKLINKLDTVLRESHFKSTTKFVNNSVYLRNLYKTLGLHSDLVLSIPKKFIEFDAPKRERKRDYVLTYLGKETEVDVILKLASKGIKIVAFGAKIPFGTSISKFRQNVDFRGYVSDQELALLYFDALYTAFPFTEEPFGWVPLESMYYGTPVLTYNKQGPSETVIHGKTGWLVDSTDEFIREGLEIWNKKDTGMRIEDCRERANFFSIGEAKRRLEAILKGVPIE